MINRSRSSAINTWCLLCGKGRHIKPFAIKNGEGKYCSLTCRNLAYKETRKGSGNSQFGTHWQAGKNNPNWKCGNVRKNGYTWDWSQIKKLVKKRDNFKCRLCGIGYGHYKRDHAVHHIDENKQNNSLENLITLCVGCHCKIHKPHLNSPVSRKASEGGDVNANSAKSED